MGVRLGDKAGQQNVKTLQPVPFPEYHLIWSDPGEIGEFVQVADLSGAERREQRQASDYLKTRSHVPTPCFTSDLNGAPANLASINRHCAKINQTIAYCANPPRR